ncbi:MAG TPA: NADH-quinone oxidoreductase subunit C, partial [Gammaproteobacteria bacterium]|nr:NADH-quinone oxidoreductase subunit C [Gammaproteobacteria bacterium]
MSKAETLSKNLAQAFAGKLQTNVVANGEVTIEVAAMNLLAVCTGLRDDERFAFEELIDICGVDYSAYGQAEWSTEQSSSGFSRGVQTASHGYMRFGDEVPLVKSDRPRFASVYHLLSVKNNQRLRVRAYAEDEAMPRVPSVIDIWNVANWYERESFDLYGIHYEGHPDLRRILTDYGFVGHPFRKDFPLSGHVEMRYDPEQKRVIYQPVSIEPRVLVPRVIRED